MYINLLRLKLQNSNELYEKDPQVAEKRKLVLKEIEEGKSEIASFAMDITLRVLQEQLKTCWRMKVHYDLLNFETHIVGSKLWSKAFELLKTNGILAISNVRDKYSNPSVHFMEWVGDWNLRYRTDDEFKKLFIDAGFKDNELKIQYEQQGIMQYIFASNKEG